MKPTKFLLLGAGALETSLHDILKSSWQDVQIKCERLVLGAGGAAHNSTEFLKSFEADLCFLILCEESLKQTGALLQLVRSLSSIPIIVVVEKSEPALMFELLKEGVADFITSPLKAVDLLPRIWRLMNKQRETGREATLARTLKEGSRLKQLIGESAKFLAEINKIPLIAKCDASVLISGETGTGKELCARAIHYLSPRASHPFVPINCGAIPLDLVENELFGHKRGAFTGASTSELGLIHEADNGTLFLDEVDHLPLLAQVKLLRFLQEKEYRPLGSGKLCKADVRLIAAMNVDPEEAAQQGKIRQDLFYRLNIISLVLPPLRERRDDIMPLAHHFLSKYAAKFQKRAQGFSAEVKQKLLMYDWPGNVRELEHVIERAVVLSDNPLIQGTDVMLSRRQALVQPESFRAAKTRCIAQFEKRYLQDLLLAYEGNVSRAAVAAKKNRRALWELIRKHQIDMQDIRSVAKSGHSTAL